MAMTMKLLWCIGVCVWLLAAYLAIGVIAFEMTGSKPIQASIVLGILVAVLVLGIRRVRPSWVRFEPLPTAPHAASDRFRWRVVSGAVLAFLAGQVLVVILYERLGSAGYDRSVDLRIESGVALTLVLVLVTAPISEEALFRGLMYPLLRQRVGTMAAALTTAVAFAALHGNVVQAAAALPGGLVMALVYERTRRLTAVIAMHMLYNVAAFSVPPAAIAAIANPISAALLMLAFGTAFGMLHREVAGEQPDQEPGVPDPAGHR
jgi:membrane protease YdiL (CAAX protease family)